MKKFALVFCLLVLLLTTDALEAQTASSEPETPQEAAVEAPVDTGTNEEITVTARRREENLQSTPISIAAYTAEALEERSMRDLSDLSDFTLNMDFSNTSVLGGSTSEAMVYIRGIGQISNELFLDPGVGIYIDGVYLARAQGSVLDLLDLERVEVLRGPQGTLFGKNTIGGAIQLVTKKPDSERDGSLELSAGDYDRLGARFRYNLPLGENVFSTIALSAAQQSGITESLFTGDDYFDDDHQTGRFALRYLPTERLTVDWSIDANREREQAADNTLLGFDESTPILQFYNQVVGEQGFTTYDSQWLTGDLHTSYSSEENFSNADNFGTSLTLNRQFDNLTLRSISSYRELDNEVANDLDGSPVRYAYRPLFTTQEQFAQELQLLGSSLDDDLSWVIGALYFTEESERIGDGDLLVGLFEALEAAPGPIYAPPGAPSVLCNPGPPPPGFPCFGGAGNPFNFAFWEDPDDFSFDTLSNTSYAAFGEATWYAGDTVSLTFGLRYTFEEKDYLLREIQGPLSPFPDLILFSEDDWERWTPRLSVGWQAMDELFLYGTVANGFKSGGFNGLRGGSSDTFLTAFDPEKMWMYEVGFKSDLLGNRLRLNGAFYFNDYEDLQMTASAIDAAGNPATVIENAGQAEVKGFELELVARPTRGFEISAGVGYVDAKYTELFDSVTGVPPDGTIPKTPEWSVVVSPQYNHFQESGGVVSFRVDFSSKSKTYNDIANTEFIAQPAYEIVNARVSWIPPSGRWEFALFGTNLGDEEYLEQALFPAGFGPAIGVAGRPREWGVSGKVHF